MREILRYLRIEKDSGLSLTTLAILCGCAAFLVLPPWFALAGFGLALLGFHVEQGREHARALQAMETNEKIALAKRSDDAEKLSERMDALEKLVKTPQYAEAQAKFAEMVQRRVSGR